MFSFTSIRLALLGAAVLFAPALNAQQQPMALTFDDLPAHGSLPPGVTRQQVIADLLAALKASGTPPVYGFVNGVRDEENPGDATVLDLWRKAGYPLGNHTWSHMNLNQQSAADWEADLLKNEPTISSRMQGEDWHWVRFPYLAEGDTPAKTAAVRTFLAAHQYRIAGVTASFADYLFNEPYARCEAKHDAAAVKSLESFYLQAAREDLKDHIAMSKAALGRPIPLVLLMHVGAFDARMLPRLLKMYQGEGVQFVSLQTAEKDPFYRNDLDPGLPAMPDTLEATAAMKHVVERPHPAPLDEALGKLCR